MFIKVSPASTYMFYFFLFLLLCAKKTNKKVERETPVNVQDINHIKKF